MKYTDYYSYLHEGWTTYKPSNNQKVLLYDFYVLSYLSTLPLDPTQKGYSGNLIGRDPNEIKLDIEHAQSVLLPILVKKLKNTLFLSICAELRHLFDKPQDYSLFKDNKLCKYYIRYYSSLTGSIPAEFKPNRDVKNPRVTAQERSYLISYKAAMMAIKKAGSSTTAFAQLAGDLFKQMKWGTSYGGNKWSAIDHAYDLQHNTGTALNKVKDFAINSNFEWIQVALDHKRNAKSMYELLPHCSSDMRKLALEAFKIANVKKPSKLQTKNSEPAPEKQNGEITVTPGVIYNIEKYGCLFHVYSVEQAEHPYKALATGKIIFIHDLHLFNRLKLLSSKKLDVDVETAIHTNFLYDLNFPGSFSARDTTGNLLRVGNEYSHIDGVEGTLVKIHQLQEKYFPFYVDLRVTKITDIVLQQAYIPNIKIGDTTKVYNTHTLTPINKNASETDKPTKKFKIGDTVLYHYLPNVRFEVIITDIPKYEDSDPQPYFAKITKIIRNGKYSGRFKVGDDLVTYEPYMSELI